MKSKEKSTIGWALAPAIGASLMLSAVASAAVTQVGDFRLTSGAFTGGYTYFDPGFGSLHASALTTRAVLAAPVQINSDFTGTSQDEGDPPANSAEDIGLQTFSAVTTIRTINRFMSDQDGPGAGGGPQLVGAVRWSFDLTPLDSYLSANSLALTALDLTLNATPSDTAPQYDVYLSYTNAGEGVTLSDISTDAAANYSDLWFPAQSSSEGSIVNGDFKVLELDHTGALALNESLLALYASGVKQFNLIIASGGFFSSRNITIDAGSGLSITTVSIPTPAALPGALAVLGFAAARRVRR